MCQQVPNITKSKAKVKDHSSDQTVPNIKLRLCFSNEVRKTNDVISNNENCYFVENLLFVDIVINKWLGMDQIHAVEECGKHEESDLDADLVVPVEGRDDEHEPSEDEDVVVLHCRSGFRLEAIVEISIFLVKSSFVGLDQTHVFFGGFS